MSSWSHGRIHVPSLYEYCEDALGFRVSTDADEFKANLDALNIFTHHLTRQQRIEIYGAYNPPYVWRKRAEDRIKPLLSVQKDGKVRLNINCREHGSRRIIGTLPTGEIMKAYNNNLKANIKRQLDEKDISTEQLKRICKVVEE